MQQQLHRVRVFVFRELGSGFEYLVVRHEPAFESFWTPLTETMRPDESIFQAAVRTAGQKLGLSAPGQVVDLQLATHLQVGDLEEVDWSVGFRARPHQSDLRPCPDLAELRWLDFDTGYRNLDLEEDRRSIMRLHFTLRSAG